MIAKIVTRRFTVAAIVSLAVLPLSAQAGLWQGFAK
jgi:hypothetical protein